MTIFGTKHRLKLTDYSQRCSRCGRLMYFEHNCNGKWVQCPFCGHLQ